MKQRCFLWNVWLTWLSLPALAIVVGIVQAWWAGVIVLLVGVVAQIVYLRIFPHISRLVGYGSVADESSELTLERPVGSPVKLYTANTCPFCPIVKQRLVKLQEKMGFELEELDITFRPQLIKEKRIRSVPVVEIDDRHWIGNATSAQLAGFLTASIVGNEEGATLR